MNLLNIIDTIYESKYFPTILIISIIVLVVLFVSVIILGMKDAKKAKEPHKPKKEEVTDITFESPKEKEQIKEDVTFEIPVLTQNLENFKKSLEEEMQREDEINVIKKAATSNDENKNKKILDKQTIDSTDVIPILETKKEEPAKIEEKVEEQPKHQRREIFKELFKDRKEKSIEPLNLIENPKKEEKENKNIVATKTELPKQVIQPTPVVKQELKEQPKKIEKKVEQPKIEIDKVLAKAASQPQKVEVQTVKNEIPKQIPKVEVSKKQIEEKPKKEQRYSGDDDF